jgi:hypothetical protein
VHLRRLVELVRRRLGRRLGRLLELVGDLDQLLVRRRVRGSAALGLEPRGLLGGLGGLHRGELLLGRQLAALGHHEGLHLDLDALEERDRDRVAADALDRVVEADLPAVDPDLPRAPDLVRDVRRRDRAEERPGGAGLHVEREHRLPQRVRDRLGLVGRRRLVAGTLGVPLLELGDLRGRGPLRQLAREEEVARVAVGHVHDLAPEAELLDVVEEDDVHRYPETYGSSAISRARLTALATCT